MRKFVFMLLMLWGIPSLANAQAAQPAAAIPVGVVTAERKSVTKSQDFVGRVEAVERVEVRARITGYLDKVAFKEGDLIKEGAPLYSIEKGLVRGRRRAGRGRAGEGQGGQDTYRNSTAARRGAVRKGSGTQVARDQALAADETGQRLASHRRGQSADRQDQSRLYRNRFSDFGQGRQDQHHQRQRRLAANRAAYRHRQPGSDVCDVSGQPARIPARPAIRKERRRHRHQGVPAVCRR